MAAARVAARGLVRPRGVISRSSCCCSRSFSSTSGGGILHHEWVSGGRIHKSRPDDGHQPQGPTVLFLHGLLGSGKNLRMPAKRLTAAHPHLTALLLDLRGHGTTSSSDTLNINSIDDWSVEHTLHACALDVVDTVQNLGLVGPTHSPIGVVGHSFGGRTALQYLHTLLHPEDTNCTGNDRHHPEDDEVHPPLSTWILDAVPGQAHSSVEEVVDKVSRISMPVGSKKELIAKLMDDHNVEQAVALWMTTNLVKSTDDNGFVWTFDLDVIRDILVDFPRQDFVELTRRIGHCYVSCPEGLGSGGRKSRVGVVMAGKNEAWTTSVVEKLERVNDTSLSSHDPFLTMHTLPEAGYNVHVDDLDGLMKLLEEGFRPQ